MNGPLSGKQQREYLKFAAKEQREDKKAELEELRKQELHEIKLQEAAQKANQALVHKEDTHAAKMEELGGPLSKSKIKVQPVTVPEMGTSGPKVGTTDTVPAMLTPGEAVIPAPAAQDPKNKPLIAQMVNEGRQGYATGTIKVKDNLPSIPIVGAKRRGVKGYADGTTEVDPYDRKLYNREYVGVLPPVPTPTPMNPVPNEAAMKAAMQDTPADKAFYATIPERPEQDKIELTKELARYKPGTMQHSILSAELAKYNSVVPPVVSKSPYDVQVVSPDWLTKKNPASPNAKMREKGAYPVIQGDKVVDLNAIPKPEVVPATAIPELPPTGAGAGRGNSQAADPEEINRVNTAAAMVAKENADVITAKAAEISALPAQPEEKKSMMASFLSDLYGDKGIFNRKDLVRFSVLAAGGLVTGGTVNGSLRYAARDVLANADKRNAQESIMADRKETALDAELRAERSKFEQFNMSVNVPPEVKKDVEKLLAFKPDATVPDKIEAVRKANIILGQHAAKVAAAGKAPQMGIEDGYIGGKPVQFREDKTTGKRYTLDKEGNWTVNSNKIVPSAEYDRQTRSITEDVTPRILAKLHKENNDKGGKESVSSLEAKAKNLTLAFRSLKEEIGDVNSVAFSKMVENTLAQSGAEGLTEEGLRKAFYGNAVIQLRPSVASKYYMVTEGDKKVPPSAEALSIYGNKLQEFVSKGLTLDEAAKELESKFDEFKKKNPEKASMLEKVRGSGFSPFLQWVRNGGV